MPSSRKIAVQFVEPALGERVAVYDEMPPPKFWVRVESGNRTNWGLYRMIRTAANVAFAEQTGPTAVQRH